jgi:hypothetical protein
MEKLIEKNQIKKFRYNASEKPCNKETRKMHHESASSIERNVNEC